MFALFYSEPLEEHANFLIPVPGGNDGPSGVLVCSENYITYKNLGEQLDIRCPIPRRRVSSVTWYFLNIWHMVSPAASSTCVLVESCLKRMDMFASLDCKVSPLDSPGMNFQHYLLRNFEMIFNWSNNTI